MRPPLPRIRHLAGIDATCPPGTCGGSVAGWIRERRPEQCRRDLADPQPATHPINAIAARWGLTNAAHFSQAFRNAYGLPLRQFREQSATVHSD
ncbi:helix-turn-helix domain-containing protein [Nonomuraea sp. NPDC003707]